MKSSTILSIIIVLIIAGLVFAAWSIWGPDKNSSDKPAQETLDFLDTSTPEEQPTNEPEDKTSETPVFSEQKTQNPSLPLMTNDGIYLIHYTPDGFYPKAIVVPAGTTVRFINNSSKGMKIFADDHLSNRIHAALNQTKTLGQGETYEFNFNDKGLWMYHNTNNTSDRGSVAVF
jgi:plastocyanin